MTELAWMCLVIDLIQHSPDWETLSRILHDANPVLQEASIYALSNNCGEKGELILKEFARTNDDPNLAIALQNVDII